MIDKVLNILQQQCTIDAKNSLLVGVSGGPDSLTLLHILQQSGFKLIAMHVNHGLRPEAEAEASFVEQFVSSLGIEFNCCVVDAFSYAQEHSVSIEEASRTLRYQTLFEEAKKDSASAVLVAHTADDQVETILMHLLRGTGLTGLRGMEYRTLPNPWSTEIPLVRPLLSTWRKEILQYVDEYGLNPTYDKSNLDISFFRNRVRHELLPVLEKYNPSIREALLRMAESLKDDYSVLQQMVDQAWISILDQQSGEYMVFNRVLFLALPLSIQRLILRKAISCYLPGLIDVGFDCIERGLMLLAGSLPGKQTDLIAGLRLRKQVDRFWLVTGEGDFPTEDLPAIPPGETRILSVPSTLDLAHGWQLVAEEVQDPEMIMLRSLANSDLYQTWMDLSEVGLPLYVRPRVPGDHIRALGLNSHRTKISDLMINLKVPKAARAAWPLICTDKEILWVPGYRMSHLVRVKPGTSKALHLTLRRRQIS